MRWGSQDNRLIALLCVLILNAYLLVYTNSPQSIDGADTLDVASTWLHHGVPAATRLTTPRQFIEGNGQEEFYTLSPDGERYSKKGITPSLALMPFVMLANWLPGVSDRAAAMLLNPLVTLLTACQLYIFARYLKTAPFVAALLALVFAFATTSIIYVKTLFGEPLAGLLLLIALYQSTVYAEEKQNWRVLLAGAAIGLAVGINMGYALLTVPIGAYIFWASRDLRAVIRYGLLIAVMFVCLGAWNMLRFGSPLETGYGLNTHVEGFTTPLHVGLIGMLLSFYKGVFWFQPILLLGLFSLRSVWKHQRALLIVSFAIIGIHSTTYATWWAWDGAWSWGGRFMVPLLPIMLLAILPALGILRRRQWGRYIVLGWIAVSFIVQVPGILYSYIPFYETVYDGQLFRWQNNIILAAFAGLFQSAYDPAVLSEGGDFIQFVAIMASVIVGLFAVYRVLGRWRYVVIAATLIFACYVTVARQEAKPSYEFVREWQQTLGTSGIAYVQSFQFDARLLDIDSMRIVVTHPHAAQENPLIHKQWQMVQQLDPIFWLVTWFPPASTENWVEAALWQQYPFVEERAIEGHRALRFQIAQPAALACETNYLMDEVVALTAYGTRHDDDGLYVTLQWQDQITPTIDYSWFVHLIDADGNVILQQDRVPQGGYHPTSTWQAGQTVSDYLFFPLPADTDISQWQLRIGYVDPSISVALPVYSANGQSPEANHLLLSVSCPN